MVGKKSCEGKRERSYLAGATAGRSERPRLEGKAGGAQERQEGRSYGPQKPPAGTLEKLAESDSRLGSRLASILLTDRRQLLDDGFMTLSITPCRYRVDRNGYITREVLGRATSLLLSSKPHLGPCFFMRLGALMKRGLEETITKNTG